MSTRIGKATLELKGLPSIAGYGCFVGKKEKEGPLSDYFQDFDMDTAMGQESWEKAESELQRKAFELALKKCGSEGREPDIVFGGDLLNQCTATGYASRDRGIPLVGLYGACSTMAESLALASVFADGGYAGTAAAITSSHFCSAERQFRFPLEYGSQRPGASQWTVTGSGCVIVSREMSGRSAVKRVSFGCVEDLGVCDINNMGCAMAPAAAGTLVQFFRDTQTSPADYGAVVTGDLGAIGSKVMRELCRREGFEVKNHLDCGKLIYDAKRQNAGAGGSGCGCSASVLCGYFLPMLERGSMSNILFMATGALMSPTSFQQGESIPSIAHLVQLVRI